MDASTGANRNGNGHADPAPESLPSAVAAPPGAPVPGAIAAPAAGALEVPRDEHGRVKKGHSLNPHGRPPGIPNKNAEFLKLLTSKELRAVWNLAKDQAKKGKNGLLEFLLDRAFLKQTPEAAGIVINNNPTAQANSYETFISQLRAERAAMTRPGMEDLGE